MREMEGEDLRFLGWRSGLDAVGGKALAGAIDGPYLEEAGGSVDEFADGVGGVSGAGGDPAVKKGGSALRRNRQEIIEESRHSEESA